MAADYDQIASELRDDPLYVDPDGAEELTAEELPFNSSDQDAVRNKLNEAEYPMYVAVLPSPGSRNAAQDLYNALGEEGTYLVVFGDRSFSTGSTQVSGGTRAIASGALGTNDDDLAEGLIEFVGRVENTLGAGTNGQGDSGSGGDGGSGGWLPLGILAAVGGGGFLLYRRNQRNRERAQLAEVRTALDEDITAYGEQLSALDLDVQTTSTVPAEAKTEYGKALDLYETAKEAADRAERPSDLKRVTTALEEGRWLLKCVDARLKGEQVPERRLPCFFDPSHGPSVEDVQWAPRGGAPRSVPACAADAQRIGHGEDPESRMVRTGDGDRPYWEAGPAYAGWAGGYFGGFLPGILWGTMLGSMMTGPFYAGEGGDAGGGEFDGGGGDFGGFDGGGGDFGGFGGGDFGGF